MSLLGKKRSFYFFTERGGATLKSGICPSGRFPPSYIHQVIIITGLNKL